MVFVPCIVVKVTESFTRSNAMRVQIMTVTVFFVWNFQKQVVTVTSVYFQLLSEDVGF